MKFDKIGRLDQRGSAFSSFSLQYCIDFCKNDTICFAASYSIQNRECVVYKSFNPDKYEIPSNTFYDTYKKEEKISDRKFIFLVILLLLPFQKKLNNKIKNLIKLCFTKVPHFYKKYLITIKRYRKKFLDLFSFLCWRYMK